jgi:transaldolase
LTTNNSLLNSEIQNGQYDTLIPQGSKIASHLEPDHCVREIAFILNARHGLNLVEQFGCLVSVELHTDVAHDVAASIEYGRRLHEICPQHFVVKVPLTPAGLIATREMRREGIAVNLTLGFSARQNYVATTLANPSYVNVFLGRLNAYVADNGLGDGHLVGEKATLASQQEVSAFARGLPQSQTRQIAASIRDPRQLEALAGVDVITIPPQVARDVPSNYTGPWRARRYDTHTTPDIGAEKACLGKLWTVAAEERKFVEQMILHAPQSPEELTGAARDHGLADLLPEFSKDQLNAIASDGKIPEHQRWRKAIMRNEVAIDSLLTMAGLADFAAAQEQLDARIRAQLS